MIKHIIILTNGETETKSYPGAVKAGRELTSVLMRLLLPRPLLFNYIFQ